MFETPSSWQVEILVTYIDVTKPAEIKDFHVHGETIREVLDKAEHILMGLETPKDVYRAEIISILLS